MAPKNGRIQVAVFGLGRAGRIHFENLIKSYRVNVAYIVEPATEIATKYLEEFNMSSDILLLPSQAKTVYEDKTISAVFVTTPTFQHEDIVRQALEHDKAVFCEKPIADGSDAVAACYDLAASTGNPLFCSFNRRYDPSIRSIYNRVRNENQVGDIHMMKTCSRDAPLPPMSYLKVSGGIFHDCCVHDIDMICWVLDEYPSSVYCAASSHIPEIKAMDDFDTVAVILKFPSNKMAMIDLSRYAAYGYDQRIEVFGNKSMIISENQSPGNVHFFNEDGIHRDPIQETFKYRYADSYWESLMHFLDVVEGKAKLEITKESCLKVVEIATACEISNHLSRPVMLPLTAEDYANRPEICGHSKDS